MLWLPKWLTTDERPEEGVTRRSFLFLGAAAGVGLLLPEQKLTQDALRLWPDANNLMGRTFIVPIHVGRNWAVGQPYRSSIRDVMLNPAEYARYQVEGVNARSLLMDRLYEQHGIDYRGDPEVRSVSVGDGLRFPGYSAFKGIDRT